MTITSITPAVSIMVPTSAYNLITGSGSHTQANAVSLSLRSNRSWMLIVQANSSMFTHTAAPGATLTTKPVSDLVIRRAGSAAFTALTTSGHTVASGSAGNNQAASFDFRLDSSFNDSPGQYAVTLTFTIVTH